MKWADAWHQKSAPEAIGKSRADAKSSRREKWITE